VNANFYFRSAGLAENPVFLFSAASAAHTPTPINLKVIRSLTLKIFFRKIKLQEKKPAREILNPPHSKALWF
jgi:hypothetical protein